MAYLKSEGVRVMNKFHKEKFTLWKFKLKIVLASMDLWGIIDRSKKVSPSNAYPELLKEYQRRIEKAISIIGLNLADN